MHACRRRTTHTRIRTGALPALYASATRTHYVAAHTHKPATCPHVRRILNNIQRHIHDVSFLLLLLTASIGLGYSFHSPIPLTEKQQWLDDVAPQAVPIGLVSPEAEN